jgi:hypothetical protein
MGDARDALIERAQTTIEKIRQVAGEVGETVEKEATYQGLTGDSEEIVVSDEAPRMQADPMMDARPVA